MLIYDKAGIMAGVDKSGEGVKPVYVICGKDKFLVGRACEGLLDSLLGAEERAMGLFQPEDGKADCAEVLDELRTLPFLAKRRVVLIKDAAGFITDNRPILEKYFDNPSPSGSLIFTVDTWAKNTKLAKKLAKMGELVSTEALKGWQLPKFIADYANSEHGKTVSKGCAELLVELVGDDPGRLCSEMDKLAMYVGDRKQVTEKDVSVLIGHNRIFDVFSVIDLMTAGNTGGAVERLRNMFANDKSSEYTAVGAFAFHFRKMFKAKRMLEKGANQNQVAGKLRVFGDRDAFFRQLRKVSLEWIGAVLCQLARIDHAVKTGQMTGSVAIEQLVFKVGS